MSPRAPALVRGLEVLEAVASSDAACGLSHLQQVTGIPRASLIRLLADLRDFGYLEREEGVYRIGARTRRLLAPGDRAQRLIACAESELIALRDQTDCSAICFGHVDGVITALSKHMHPAAPSMQAIGSTSKRPSGLTPWAWILWWEGRCEALTPSIPRGVRGHYKRTGVVYDDCAVIPFVRRLTVPIRSAAGDRIDGFLALGGNPLLLPDEQILPAGERLLASAQRIAEAMRRLG
ncbi:MAG: helix-turn-helix domain-containing protein [Planctomycetota bacterium]|jgi:DNA-binding IclR family transcriptional regulator|nr:helix-turn-helix domain-containing protein [Planctomycetota bacterium]